MKRVIIATLFIYVICMGATIAMMSLEPDSGSNIVAINDLIQTSNEESWDDLKLAQELNTFHTDAEIERQDKSNRILIGTCLILTVFTAVLIVILFIIDRRFLRPFREMEEFAHLVAAGNLDAPLLVDKENSFGAFTESFDLMRTELSRAKEAERQANQSKKELIATLSHDIKTPLASIKATAELTAAKASDKATAEPSETIVAKVDQVTSLVDTLFTSTMEELHELEVKPDEVSSKTIEELLYRSDYRKKLILDEVPDCLVRADETRLMQVFDNIISNSYKYADTAIEVRTVLESERLLIDIADYGEGVDDEELLLLTQKFYRGSNVGEQPGVGLGLFNAAYFIQSMDGELHCFNEGDRFVIRIALQLI